MSDDGFSVKVTTFYDGVNDNNIMRLDVLFGYAAPYGELACKVVAQHLNPLRRAPFLLKAPS
jgi:hypothetical protein